MDAAETPVSSDEVRPSRARNPYHGGPGGPWETGPCPPISPGIPFTRLDAAVVGFTAAGFTGTGTRTRARGWNPLKTKGER